MLCSKQVFYYASDINPTVVAVKVPCGYKLNTNGKCPNAENHIPEKECDHPGCTGGPCSKNAEIGKPPTRSKQESAAETWVEEAKRMANLSVRYYNTAADKFEEAGCTGSATFYRNKADRISRG